MCVGVWIWIITDDTWAVSKTSSDSFQGNTTQLLSLLSWGVHEIFTVSKSKTWDNYCLQDITSRLQDIMTHVHCFQDVRHSLSPEHHEIFTVSRTSWNNQTLTMCSMLCSTLSEGTAQLFNTTELKSHLFLVLSFHWRKVKPFNQRGEETRVLGEKLWQLTSANAAYCF